MRLLQLGRLLAALLQQAVFLGRRPRRSARGSRQSVLAPFISSRRRWPPASARPGPCSARAAWRSAVDAHWLTSCRSLRDPGAALLLGRRCRPVSRSARCRCSRPTRFFLFVGPTSSRRRSTEAARLGLDLQQRGGDLVGFVEHFQRVAVPAWLRPGAWKLL